MSELRNCIVFKRNNKEEFLCDNSVYSKNRQFRMYLSSKLGKNKFLLYNTKYCKFYGKELKIFKIFFLESGISAEKIFFDSLVIPRNYEEYELIDVSPLVERAIEIGRNYSNFNQVLPGKFF
jgi:hypothetical protein